MIGQVYRERGHQRVTVSTAAIGLTVPAHSIYALMRVKGTAGDGLCYRSDATDPTSTTGMELEVGEVLWFDARLDSFKAIRRNSADVTLIVAYYGVG